MYYAALLVEDLIRAKYVPQSLKTIRNACLNYNENDKNTIIHVRVIKVTCGCYRPEWYNSCRRSLCNRSTEVDANPSTVSSVHTATSSPEHADATPQIFICTEIQSIKNKCNMACNCVLHLPLHYIQFVADALFNKLQANKMTHKLVTNVIHHIH